MVQRAKIRMATFRMARAGSVRLRVKRAKKG